MLLKKLSFRIEMMVAFPYFLTRSKYLSLGRKIVAS